MAQKLEMWHLSYFIFPAFILLHLYVAPYTKVEESFNMQATHDILTYGVPTNNYYLRLKAHYDHMTFAGAVPRSFVGSLVLAALARPFVWCWALNGEQQQFLGELLEKINSDIGANGFIVRALLGLFNAAALISYTTGVRRAYGKVAAEWNMWLQASQFHILFYSSRTLPNMFAFGTSTFALRFFLPDPASKRSKVKQTKLALYLLTLPTVIFRSELGLLLGAHCLYILFKSGSLANGITLVRTTFIPAIFAAAVVGLVLTVSIDTFFWQSHTLLWPELAGFISNVLPSKGSLGASAWGTSPWHWYFTSALPRLLINPLLLLLIPWGFVASYSGVPLSLLDLLTPPFIYTAIYSLLPHKETRFLFPIIPPLTASLALIASHATIRMNRSITHRLITYILLTTTLISTYMSHGLLLPLSAQTYPGGAAISSLHAISLKYRHQPQIRVHLTNLALQTGVTHFLDTPSSALHDRALFVLPGSPDGRKRTIAPKTRARWIYDKSDNATEFLMPAFWAQFDYVVVEDPRRVIGAWDVVDKVPGLGKPSIMAPDVGRGLLVFGGKNTNGKERATREDDGLSRLVGSMYGHVGKWVYGVLHDVLREGYGMETIFGSSLGKDFSWTRGWWLHWSLETKLYILKRAEGGMRPS
ncbi:hypothetical protein LTR84_012494 [Exophiala bonariae]|uniref:Mannosyltransferase n=1 Tax=Exophiala bonariae TaxID=1690606 RepID=A0AAV9NGE9_9EURO|nr:hypothetical protein LTR84_012494 [Exophiala bonariae]